MNMRPNIIRNDKRQFGRRSSYWHAWVIMNGKRRLPCVVLNISKTGALLEFADILPNTSQFRLVIESHDFDVECQVRHIRSQFVGVYFSHAIYG
jgi:hypothetical protein